MQKCETADIPPFYDEGRDTIKSLHMRAYFDSPRDIGYHTRNVMGLMKYMSTQQQRDDIDNEMFLLKDIVTTAEGGNLFDSEIFLHESCIYMDVLEHLLKEGFLVWECYDSWYAYKEGWTQ